MNHIYRVVYNTASQTYQAVPEISKGKHKSCAEKTSAAASKTPTFAGKLRALCAALLALTCPFALAAPTGGAVSAGQAAIHQAGNITDIRQSSQNAAINWQNFSIGAHETVNFHQPNAQSLTLNRVIGNERSIIDGAMNANGKVFISNPNGMLIGRDAQINVGSLVATTAQISNDDFMNGRYQFTNAKGEIENLGNITVPQGGVVALIAPIVKHSGTITAPKAHTLLASADSFSITLPDNANFAYTLDKGTLQGLVDNGGAILADGGRVVLTAKGVDSVKKSLIKHTGVIEANTVQNKNGVIELLGDLDNSALNVSGSLKAEGKGADKGGFVETSASQVKIHDSAVVSTKSEQRQTGTWLIDPKDLIIANSGGDMTATQVENALKSNNIALHTIRNTQGKNDGKGDIKINDAISWNANTLTLNAENDIHINANLNGSGTAKLALEYGQGTADGGDSDYHIKRGVKVNLPMGNTLTTQKGSNGEKVEFNVIHKMPEIVKNTDGDWQSKFTTRNIAFGADIDLSFTKNLKNFNGWEASYVHMLGLGHKIKNLTLDVNKPDLEGAKIGLFSHFNGTIKDLYAENIDIKALVNHGYVGGIVGWGANFDNYTGTYSTTLENVHMNGKIRVDAENSTVGGIIARNSDVHIDGMVKNSSADVDISVKSKNGHYINMGGIAGNSHVKNVTSSGNLNYIGNSDLEDYTGAWGFNEIGGLVGHGNVVSSYSDINLNIDFDHPGNIEIGGLVGSGLVNDSYYEGDMNVRIGKSKVGDVWQDSNKQYGEIGGLIGSTAGYNPDAVRSSYFNGNIKVDSYYNSAVGALVGEFLADYHKIKTSYYNKDKTSLKAVGLATELAKPVDYPLELHKSSDNELKTKSTFKDWDFENVWYMNKNADGTYSYPMLRAFAQTLTVNPTPTPPTAQTTADVKAPDLSKTYDGKAVNTVDDLKKLNGWKDNFDADGLTTGDSVDGIFKAGTLTIDETKGDWKGAKDVKEGGYSLYPTGTLKDEYQQKYIIEWNKGTLTINKKPITIAANSYYDGTDTAKIYDKNDKFFGKQIMGFNGIVKGDDVSLKLGAAGTLNSNQAGNTTLKDLGNLALEGASANNYTINKDGSTWTINKRPIKVTGSREYNGSEWVNGADLNIDKSDIVGKDQILLNVYTGDAKLDGKDTKNGRKIVDTSKIYFGGKDGENYEIDKSRSSVDITPRSLSISVSKDFDGNNVFKSNFIAGNLVDNETVNISGQATVASHKEGVYKSFSSHSLEADNPNYKIGDVINAEINYLTIDPLNHEIYKEVTKYDELVYGKNRFKYDPDSHIRIYDDYELNRLPTDKLQEIVNTMRAGGVLTLLPKEQRDFYANMQYIINDAHHFDTQWDNIAAIRGSWLSKEGLSVWTKTIVNMADATATLVSNGIIDIDKFNPDSNAIHKFLNIFVSNGIIDIDKFNPDSHAIYKYLNILGNSDAVKRILDGGTSVLDESIADQLRNMIYGGFDIYFVANGTEQGKQIKEVTESLSKLIIALIQSDDVGATEAILAVTGISAEIISSLAPEGGVKVLSKLVAIGLDSVNNGMALDKKADELFVEFSKYTNSYWDATRNYYNRKQLIETIRYNQQLNQQKRENQNTILLKY